MSGFAILAARAGAAALAILLSGHAWAAQWKETGGTRIPLPPPEHPRLYLRAAQVGQIKARLAHPTLKPAVDRLQSQARTSAQLKIEWQALQYLAKADQKLGRSTVEQCLDILRKCELPDRMDACRVTGRMMVTGAIVYDWLYPLLSADEKQAFIRELVRLAKTQECGYPPTRQGSVTGHSSEAQIMRDMLSAGIAIYDEFPEMYDLAAGRFFREHLPVRNWIYDGHAYHQGDSYGPYRFAWDTFPLLIFNRMGFGNIYNPAQRHVPYYWLYITRPDGQRLRSGDTFSHSAPRGRPWPEGIGTLLVASYYKDPILLARHISQNANRDGEAIFDILWRDIELQPKGHDNLPLSRYFGFPFGWMVARTGWGDDAVIAEMKVNEYNFVNHQHLDAGNFHIYYRGTLAADSGVYSGSSGAYGSPHCMNYFWRTIAHNTLLIHDPNEDFGRKGYGNDGGQRLPNGRSEARDLKMLTDSAKGYRTGKVLDHGFGPDADTPHFTILSGDITAAYSAKVRKVVRSMVFLNLRNQRVPAAMIVFDRVISAKPSFRKYWLLHSLEEPRLDAASATIDCTQHGGRGRLALDVLYPPAENLELTKVGGPGKEYWVFGTNYTNDVSADRVERQSIELANWRIEVSPKAAAEEDLFLNVMQVSDQQRPERWPARRMETPQHLGCLIEGPDASWLVLFRRDADRSAEDVKLAVPTGRPTRVLVANLAPGRWRATSAGGQTIQIQVSADSGAAWFEAAAGEWTLTRIAQP